MSAQFQMNGSNLPRSMTYDDRRSYERRDESHETPCNTLCVNNLSRDTREEDLMVLFSQQRGYRNLCYRMSPDGPMCFVEFNDPNDAAKAIDDLYGHVLGNRVSGGIHLSFAKNSSGGRNSPVRRASTSSRRSSTSSRSRASTTSRGPSYHDAPRQQPQQPEMQGYRGSGPASRPEYDNHSEHDYEAHPQYADPSMYMNIRPRALGGDF
ncbi:MAG: cell cycle RNA binding protein whi3 [Cirrosporium novae-zelandiae]|nr:MAG: cell cycle RNA binding protein whi3 [Cirrosporium novae-zelandiae]